MDLPEQLGTTAPNASVSRGTIALRLRLIGTMQAWTRANQNVLPLGRKTRALLAIVALAAPRPVTRSRLAALLWSRRLEEQARASLRQEIHRLGEALQPTGTEIVQVTRDQLWLRPDTVWIDVEEVLLATAHDPSALSLLDSDLLDGFDGLDPAFDAWLAQQRETLRRHARSVAETLVDESGPPDTVLAAARQLVGIDRTHEGAWQAIMRAHAARGERSQAVQAFEHCRQALAAAIGAKPSAETQDLLATIRAGSALPGAGSAPPATDLQRPQLGGAPRLGVLPLQLDGTGLDLAGLSIGLAEGVTAALARFRTLVLTSPAALARADTRDERTLRERFGLDLLLDGSVQKVGDRVRVSMRLLDLRLGGRVAWAGQFDRDAVDLLGLQDTVGAEMAVQVEQEVQQTEAHRAASLRPEDCTTYDLIPRALALVGRMRRDEFDLAGRLLAAALAKDPDYATVHAAHAYWAMFGLGQGWYERRADLTDAAGGSAARAILLDPQDARALTLAGHVRAYVFHRPREALELHSRALAMNPNLAMAWGLSATTNTYLGRLDEAERQFARHRQLSPNDPAAYFYDACTVRLKLSQRDYDSAVQLGRRSTELNPFYLPGLQNYLAALGHAGLLAEAATIRQRVLAVSPTFTVAVAMARDAYEAQSDRRHYAAGLRLAGLAEGDPG